MAFTPVTNNAEDIKKKKDVPFTGRYKGMDQIQTKIGPQVIWNFIQTDGRPIGIYGFTSLNNAMNKIAVGSLCRITYQGTKNMQTKFGMKDVHQALVEVDYDAGVEFSGPVMGSKVFEDEEPPQEEETPF